MTTSIVGPGQGHRSFLMAIHAPPLRLRHNLVVSLANQGDRLGETLLRDDEKYTFTGHSDIAKAG